VKGRRSRAIFTTWYDRLLDGRTAEKLLTIVRAIFGYAHSQGWIEQNPTASNEAAGALLGRLRLLLARGDQRARRCRRDRAGRRRLPHRGDSCDTQEREGQKRPDGPGRLRQRTPFTGDEDPLFVRAAGGHLVADVLRRRYVSAVKRAGLRPLPFHSLRHYFGSMAGNRASLVQVQSWMGHSHIQTTARYLHAKSQADDTELLARAFAGAAAP
jgi:site-specific recombinase XerD